MHTTAGWCVPADAVAGNTVCRAGSTFIIPLAPRMASQINVWVDREGWVWVYGMEGTGVYDLVEHRWINNLESLVPLRNVFPAWRQGLIHG